jgi:DNA-binding NarL/FixJ family response regulator
LNGERRKLAPFLRDEALRHLGAHAVGFGKKFESRVWTLFRRGLTDAAIAEMLGVNTMTVNRRTKQWRKSRSGKLRRR